jgi:glycosyltransferase involved in cell wall biosynthesis
VQVVHGTNYVAPPSRRARLVSVYDCWFLRNPERANGAVVRAGAVLRRAIAGGAHVHTSSHATTSAMRELFPDATVYTVHLGALPLPAAPAAAPVAELAGRPYVLAIGTLEQRKNLPALVTAFGHLAADHPDLLLVLAGGDGDDRPAIDAAVDALGPGVSHRVLFAGRVHDAARSWLLHHAAVLAYPSLDEGFGFPLLDAMQARVPVVASNAGSIPEVAGDAALLCPPDDAAALAANLASALTDTAERARLITAGDQRWRTFTWERCAEQMAALYHSLAEDHS